MRPRLGVLRVLACLFLVGSVGACTTTDHPDGSGQWAEPSAPSAAGKVGTCHVNVSTVSIPASDKPTDCAKPHRAETFSVGTFPAEYAKRVTLPASGSPALRWAFKTCDAEGKRFVGGDWRAGRLSIQVVVPSPESWDDGSRWYRCDICELDAMYSGTPSQAVERTGSLRAALTRRSPLMHTCFNEDKLHYLLAVACDRRHRFEFAGISTGPEVRYDDLDEYETQLFKNCRSVVGRYVGVSKKVDMADYVGVTYRPPSPSDWGRGDRGIRCFLWSDKHVLTRSVKGAGLRALG